MLWSSAWTIGNNEGFIRKSLYPQFSIHRKWNYQGNPIFIVFKRFRQSILKLTQCLWSMARCSIQRNLWNIPGKTWILAEVSWALALEFIRNINLCQFRESGAILADRKIVENRLIFRIGAIFNGMYDFRHIRNEYDKQNSAQLL